MLKEKPGRAVKKFYFWNILQTTFVTFGSVTKQEVILSLILKAKERTKKELKHLSTSAHLYAELKCWQ